MYQENLMLVCSGEVWYDYACIVLFGLYEEAVFLILDFVELLHKVSSFLLYFIPFFSQLLPTRPPFSNVFDFLSENYFWHQYRIISDTPCSPFSNVWKQKSCRLSSVYLLQSKQLVCQQNLYNCKAFNHRHIMSIKQVCCFDILISGSNQDQPSGSNKRSCEL